MIDVILNLSKSNYMKSRISASETARNFSELMNRVRYRNESLSVERAGKPICEILPRGHPSSAAPNGSVRSRCEVEIIFPWYIRKRLKMSQRQFAALLGIPLATLQNWEQNRVMMEPATGALMRILGA
jgi:hypothetical protein